MDTTTPFNANDPRNINERLTKLRSKLGANSPSVGTWLQLNSPDTAEIVASAGYDWIAVDLEHGCIDISSLPDIFRAISLSSTLPLVRLPDKNTTTLKRCLDAGAAGFIIPNILDSSELNVLMDSSRWPPSGGRGVGFCRVNQYGKRFKPYHQLSQCPFVVPMIENIKALACLDEVLSLNIDAIFIGPYDLSASMGITGELDNPELTKTIEKILEKCREYNVPCGMHQVSPKSNELYSLIKRGFLFIAYSMDSVFLNQASKKPLLTEL